MAGIVSQDSSGFFGEQDKDAFLDWTFRLDGGALQPGDSVVSSSWSAPAGITITPGAHTSTSLTVWVQGGTPRTWYPITVEYTTALGRSDQLTFRLFIKEDAEATDPSGTALFPNRFTAIAALRSEYASKLSSYVDLASIPDGELFDKLRAAEAEASRQLRVFFQPTVVIPDDAPQSEVDALEQAGTPFAQEAAYDYDPDFFLGERWGYIVAGHSPVISVESIKMAYPDPGHQVWEIPAAWIRLDRQYGHVRLVPASQAFSAPLSAFIMQTLGGGRTIPFMIQMRYTAGLKNPAADYPDLVDVVKKMAALRILQSAFLPQSGSISADGLSQSHSVDVQKWHDGIEDKLDALRDAIHGVRTIAL